MHGNFSCRRPQTKTDDAEKIITLKYVRVRTPQCLEACSISKEIHHRKLLSNRLNVYPMKGRLISGLSSCWGALATEALRAACAALSKVALSVWSISSVGK